MDPNACLDRMYAALLEDDYQEAKDAAKDLLSWLSRGGFPPEDHTVLQAEHICNDMIRLCTDELRRMDQNDITPTTLFRR